MSTENQVVSKTVETYLLPILTEVRENVTIYT